MSDTEVAPLISEFLVDMKSYDIGECIRRNPFTEIYRAVDKGTGCPVLVKRFLRPDQFDWAKKEVKILSVKNPLFVEMIGFAMSDREASIVFRNVANGTLNNVLQDEEEGIFVRLGWDATSKSKCIFGIAAAMSAVHARRLRFGNLTPDDIFLDENFEPLLGGFEISSEFHQMWKKDLVVQ